MARTIDRIAIFQRTYFFQKIRSRGKLGKHYTSRVLYIPSYPPNSPIFGAKPLSRRRFLQHYYRAASKVKTGNLKSIQKNLHISKKNTTFAAKYIANQFKAYEKNNPIWPCARSTTQRMLQTRTNIRLHRGQIL